MYWYGFITGLVAGAVLTIVIIVLFALAMIQKKDESYEDESEEE